MFLMLLAGFLSINKLNRQFFPNFDVEMISVSIEWPGATAEEVDNNIVQLLEPDLRPISGVKKVKSKSVEGLGYSIIEFNFGTDMQKAMSDVENAISRIDFPGKSILEIAFSTSDIAFCISVPKLNSILSLIHI